MAHGSRLTAIPIVFYHDNNQPYLKAAIDCARKHNDVVVLLGNASNKTFSPKWYDTNNFTDTGYEEFERSFVNMSSNSAKFEVVCFKRYFMLYRYMCLENIDCAMMLDSDVLCYVNCSSPEFIDMVSSKAAAFSVVGKWTGQACGPQFLFMTREAVKNFIDFCLDMYQNRFDILQNKYHNEYVLTGSLGGICDMELLSMWAQTIERECILNWSEQDTYLIDHHVNTPSYQITGQFRMDRLLGIKDIKYIDGMPYCYDLLKKTWRKAHVLHFQGAAKRFMVDYFFERPYLVKVLHQLLWKSRRLASRLTPKWMKQCVKSILGLNR